MFMLVIVIVIGVLRGGKGQSLSCYSCGKLSSDLSMMEDCINTTTTTLITCREGEACVTYISNYKEASAPIRGCFPINSFLPSFGPAPLISSPVCEVQEAGTVSACMCTTTECNYEGNPFRKSNQLPRKPRDAASREPKNFIFPFANSSTVAKPLPREGRRAGLKCFSCGSLFNRDSPQCRQFDPDNEQQVMTCNEGEACMLYTWKKSSTEIGSYRECFSTSILLGHPDYPITPMTTCSLSRTQQDTRSSIRACLCTQDFCNNVQDGLASVTCPVLTVTNADFADCNGDYSVTGLVRVAWAGDRPVYAHADKDRFIFWNAGGLGWSIGKREYLSSGSHWHRSMWRR